MSFFVFMLDCFEKMGNILEKNEKENKPLTIGNSIIGTLSFTVDDNKEILQKYQDLKKKHHVQDEERRLGMCLENKHHNNCLVYGNTSFLMYILYFRNKQKVMNNVCQFEKEFESFLQDKKIPHTFSDIQDLPIII